MDGRPGRTAAESELARELARRTGTEAGDWSCVMKARYGMLACLEALREARGAGSVVTQLLTCCTAVDPILGAGLVPRYGELSAATLSLDPEALELPGDVRAVVVQHTFGVVDDAATERVAELAHERGALVVEDCAHCVGRMAHTRSGAPAADVSVHSFGVEKMCPTYFGGLVWVNPAGADPGLGRALRDRLAALPLPSPRLGRAARSYGTQIRVLNHLPAGLSRALRDRLAASGRFEPAVAPCERAGRVSGVPCRPSAWVAGRCLDALRGLDDAEAAREETVAAYRAELAARGLARLAPAAVLEGDAQPLMRLPLVLPDEGAADACVAAVRAEGLYADHWGRPELTPGATDPVAYRVPDDRSRLAVSTAASRGVAALPADVGAEGARRAVAAVASAIAS